MHLCTSKDVWPSIFSANLSHQLDNAPKILSWFTEWIVRSINSLVPESAVKNSVSSWFSLQYSSVERTCTSEYWMTTFCKMLFISRTEEWPMSSPKSFCAISHEIQCGEFPFFVQAMPFNIDMNRILTSNCSGFIRWAFRSFWISPTISIVVNPGKILQTTLHTRLIVESLWSDFSIFHSLLNDYASFPDTRPNLSRHAPLLSPTWSLDHDT